MSLSHCSYVLEHAGLAYDLSGPRKLQNKLGFYSLRKFPQHNVTLWGD